VSTSSGVGKVKESSRHEIRRFTMSEGQEEMKVDPARAKSLVSALQSVSERVAKAAGGRNVCLTSIFYSYGLVI
jgi:hypothetical protein